MKHDKYCEICGRKVAKLYCITINKYYQIEHRICSECIEAVKNYIRNRSTK